MASDSPLRAKGRLSIRALWAMLSLPGNPVLGHKKGSPFADGPLFAKAADLGTFSEHRENSELLRKLNKRLKLFRGDDGWFARGRQGQLWEYGAGKLGFTVGDRDYD